MQGGVYLPMYLMEDVPMAAKSKNHNNHDNETAQYKDVFDRKPAGKYVDEYVYPVDHVRHTDLLDVAKALRKNPGSDESDKE
jgi:hypothetical protein